MGVRISFPVAGYRVQADISVPKGELRNSDLLPVLREISSKLTSAVIEREESQGYSISCRKGCSACCKRIYVEISEVEAYLLQDVIQSLSEDHRERILARFDTIRKRLKQAGIYEDLLQTRLFDAEERERMAIAYYGQKIICPFLEDNACSIYNERPLACREYLVTSPAEECERPDAGGVRRVSFPWPSYIYLMRMAQHDTSKERLVPLVLLPDWLAQHPEPVERINGLERVMHMFGDTPLEITTPQGEDTVQSVALSSRIHEDDNILSDGCIVPDYALPDALMVPHYGLDRIELLEQIASTASKSIGVIMLTPDAGRTQAFIDRQASPERFSILIAASNTAWIRDRSPIAVRVRKQEMQWYLPQMPDDGRDADANLFETISAHRVHRSPFKLARGNLVSGSDGLALSTTSVLEENNDRDIQGLTHGARQLGIRKWIVFSPFGEEPSRHADMHVRFLDEDIAAIGWNLSSDRDRASAELLIDQLIDARPSLRILRIPMRSEGQKYASPLNWVQLGKDLIVPRYPLTEEQDLDQIRSLLESEHFRPSFIDSPTLEVGGSLHCLTASIYV